MTESESERRAARRNLVVFYALATLIAWAGWIPYGAQQAFGLAWHVPVGLTVLTQYSPTIAALVMVAVEGGFAGLARFVKTSLDPRVGLRWYFVALLTAPAMGAALVLLHALRDVPMPAFADLANWPAHMAALIPVNPHASGGAMAALRRFALAGGIQAALVFLGFAIANGGISEEAGWRGYAFPKLFSGRTAFTAALWLGLLWGVWHTGPAFWTGIFRGDLRVFRIPLEYTLGTLPLTVMIVWVFLNAKRSLLPGVVFHASYNGTYFFLTQLWTGKPVVSIPEWLAATYVAAALVAIVGRKTLFARNDDDMQDASAARTLRAA